MSNNSQQLKQAFEYVVGTLSHDERMEFEALIKQDSDVAAMVHEWEEKLIGLTHQVEPIKPKTSTYQKIQARINKQLGAGEENPFWQKLMPWKWATSVAFAMLFAVSMLYFSGLQNSGKPNADYLAVLLDESEQPILTALTATEGSTLWLKWEKWSAPTGRSIQLWAKSRRDGEVRPLLVFGQQQLNEIILDEATLRLIQDSSHLIMTEEEVGGSAIDEPSDMVIATGVCIRLKETRGKA